MAGEHEHLVTCVHSEGAERMSMCFLPFLPRGASVHECAAHIQSEFSLHKPNTQRCVSKVIPNLVMLPVKIKHLTTFPGALCLCIKGPGRLLGMHSKQLLHRLGNQHALANLGHCNKWTRSRTSTEQE